MCLCLSVCDTESMFNCMCVCARLIVCACSQPVRRTGRRRQIIGMAAPAVPQIWCEEESEGRGGKKSCHLSFKRLMLPRNGMSERTSGAKRTYTHTRPTHKLNQNSSRSQQEAADSQERLLVQTNMPIYTHINTRRQTLHKAFATVGQAKNRNFTPVLGF